MSLDENIIELKSNCFISVNSDVNIKAKYGFTRKQNDSGKLDKKVYVLTFTLPSPNEENITYSVKLNFKGKEYNEQFKLNPVLHHLSASMEVDNFTPDEFSIKLSYGSEIEDVIMKSALPKNTLSYSAALSSLQNQQSQLINSYLENNQFKANIVMRVLVKDSHPYWYIGLINQSGTKAMLIDGTNGKLLAVRDVF